MTEKKAGIVEDVGDIFEIRDDDINIKVIDKQIRENIIKRKNLASIDIEDIIKKPLLPPTVSEYYSEKNVSDTNPDINYINSNWNIQVEYKISSHRRVIGRLLVWGRTLINGEVKRYVDLITTRQSELNNKIMSVLNNINKKIEYDRVLDKKIQDEDNKIEDINDKIKEVDNKIEDINDKIKEVDKIEDINEKLKEVYSRIGNIDEEIKVVDSRIGNIQEENDADIDNINYFIFNESFGGSKTEIRTNMEQFIEFFLGCKNVLDIGSGRGIFLELLKTKGINGYGIDLDDDLILYCNRNDLNVQKDDAILHLKKLENKSLDGIFISHLIEHIKYKDIFCLLKLCYDKMQYGSYLVIATPNILNMMVSSNTFYTDPSHTTHIHPELMKFLLKTYGFRDIQERFYQPTNKDQMLKKLKLDDDIDNLNDEQKKIYEIMNHNIDILNNLLFGNRDYAVIAKK